jgi:hypothetical protein
MSYCELCKLEYDENEMNFHHLIPKTFHNNKRILKQYDKDFLNKNGVNLCYARHNKLHSCIDEKELAFEFNSIEKIKMNAEIQKWINWKQKHPDFNSVYNRMTNKRRGK